MSARYGRVSLAEDGIEMNDMCLTHPSGRSGVLHYHTSSPCHADPTWFETGEMNDHENALNNIRITWGGNYPYKSVLCLFKDGRPIYGPFHGDG